MIEIFIIIMIYRKLASVAALKGRSSAFGWIGVLGWVSGEILGAIVAAMLGGRGLGGIYVGALAGALLGLGIAWTIVSRLAPAPSIEASAFD